MSLRGIVEVGLRRTRPLAVGHAELRRHAELAVCHAELDRAFGGCYVCPLGSVPVAAAARSEPAVSLLILLARAGVQPGPLARDQTAHDHHSLRWWQVWCNPCCHPVVVPSVVQSLHDHYRLWWWQVWCNPCRKCGAILAAKRQGPCPDCPHRPMVLCPPGPVPGCAAHAQRSLCAARAEAAAQVAHAGQRPCPFGA